MSEPEDGAENFLQRWSRRKHAAVHRHSEGEAPETAKAETHLPHGSPTGNPTAASSGPPIFDPATLPPIETITATSDIRAFLAPGVPEELSRAALRRAWSSDPAIRDFIGIAENQWDFTKPDSVPGFGSLEMTPELRRLLAQLVGDAPKEPLAQLSTEPTSAQRAERLAELPPPMTPAVDGDDAVQARLQTDDDAATQGGASETSPGEASVWRKHGSAMPK